MTDESLLLDIDIIEKEHEQKLAAAIAEKDAVISEKLAEIAYLKEQIATLTQQNHSE